MYRSLLPPDHPMPSGLGPLQVLVVDDEALLADELALGLGEAGFAVHTAGSAAAAEVLLANNPRIGVVVTDVRMPGEDGLSFVRRLLVGRTGEAAVQTVVMTGHATLDDAAEAVRTGAADFLRKPFALADMAAAVDKAMQIALRQRAGARALAQAALRVAEAEAERDELRDHDPATGLLNRCGFAAVMERLNGGGGAPEYGAAVIRFHVDGLAATRQAGGTTAADAVLAEMARRLECAAASDWTLARLGDEEFAAVTELGWAQAAALVAAERLREAVETPFGSHGRRVVLTATLGVARSAATGGVPLDVAAGIALGAARQAGRSRTMLFEPGMRDAASRRHAIAEALPDAIVEGRFRLHYQPIVRVADLALLGFEALIRWHHPDLGEVSPAEFIPIAEEGRLILDLGGWTLAEAGRQAGRWRAAVEGGLHIAVNISGRQATETDLPAQFARVLQAERLPASALVAEVTETVATGPGAVGAISDLGAMGVRVALDDFGVGYSSLGMLRSLPVRTVKLDRSLLDQVAVDPRAEDFCGGLVGAIRALGLDVIAEGVETEAQLRSLRRTACEAAQGWLFGRPLRAEEAGKRLASTLPLAA